MRRVIAGVFIGVVAILSACSQFEVDPPPLPENVWYPDEREVIAKGEGNDPETGPFYYIFYWWHAEAIQLRVPVEGGYHVWREGVRQPRVPFEGAEDCYNAATVREPLPLECPQPE